MTARGTASRFLQSVLQNGVGREFIEEGVVDFAKRNPGIVVYVTPNRGSVPKLVGEYLNGTVKEEALKSKTHEQVAQLMEKMAGQSGLDIIRIRKPFHTDSPSIQGQWTPFVNKPSALNVRDFSKGGERLPEGSS
uniref:large ribosomal subunit protein mL43 isoform X2 n=1 Tax=Pristiophorus japonicus TaxID=55135 RepID=UPI00398EA7DD